MNAFCMVMCLFVAWLSYSGFVVDLQAFVFMSYFHVVFHLPFSSQDWFSIMIRDCVPETDCVVAWGGLFSCPYKRKCHRYRCCAIDTKFANEYMFTAWKRFNIEMKHWEDPLAVLFASILWHDWVDRATEAEILTCYRC